MRIQHKTSKQFSLKIGNKKADLQKSAFCLFPAVFIKTRVEGVEVLAVESVGKDTQPFANLTKSKRCPKALDT